MTDSVRASFLAAQYEESMAFAQQSSVLSLAPIGGTPPARYIAKFDCDGLVDTDDGIAVCERHLVGISFPEHYQSVSCDPGEVLTWLEPRSAFHPNIRAPFCCVGHIPPGMTLLSLLHQLYTMITWQRFTPCEDKAMNRAACSWARKHLDRLPVDPRRSMLDARSDQRGPEEMRANDHE